MNFDKKKAEHPQIDNGFLFYDPKVLSENVLTRTY